MIVLCLPVTWLLLMIVQVAAKMHIHKPGCSLVWNCGLFLRAGSWADCCVLQVIVRSTITHKGGFKAKPPMVMLQLNKDFEVGGHSGGPSGKLHPDSLRASEPHAKSGGLVSPLFCLTSLQMHEPFVTDLPLHKISLLLASDASCVGYV